MSKTILANVDGFTPVIDALAKEYGLIRAAVFGRMWRYCQMQDGVCRASLETISMDLGIDRATVLRHAQELVTNGYLEDTTPDLRNRPHIYKDTGKAGISISIGVAQSNVTVAERNTGVAQSNVTVAESQLKKVLKKESKRQKEDTVGARQPRAPDPLFDSICEVCSIDPSIPGNGSSIGKVRAALITAVPPYTADEVRAWGARQAWRHTPPTVWQLRAEIGAVRGNGHSSGGVTGFDAVLQVAREMGVDLHGK